MLARRVRPTILDASPWAERSLDAIQGTLNEYVSKPVTRVRALRVRDFSLKEMYGEWASGQISWHSTWYTYVHAQQTHNVHIHQPFTCNSLTFHAQFYVYDRSQPDACHSGRDASAGILCPPSLGKFFLHPEAHSSGPQVHSRAP